MVAGHRFRCGRLLCVVFEQPRHEPEKRRRAKREAGFQGEANRGEHHAREATARLPFRIIRHVGEDRPDERNRRRIDNRAENRQRDHAIHICGLEEIKRKRIDGREREARHRHGFLAKPVRERRREQNDGDGRQRAHHVDDAVEHVGDVGTGEVVTRAVDDVTEPFKNAAGLGRALGQCRCGEADFFHEVKHRGLVGVMMVVIVKRTATE